ncbi:MAG TPA: phenylalanine--tRNA ligase beta subunit-related protein [Acidobacteriota bacterium]|nr:phenylalanine--tRNA ligase beta subunit-related protein [Acidobacteriota bacterium]
MKTVPSLAYDPGIAPRTVRAALIWGTGMPGCLKTTSMPGYLAEILERARAAGVEFIPPQRRVKVRNMLRYGKFKPSGRSRPASEYLLASALAGAFPLVNGPVDVNNAVSLESGYPASIFDLALSGPTLLLRRGVAGEAYIFNPAGQRIDCEDLLCVCREDAAGWIPCGNPVKDSMETKTCEKTRDVVAVICAPIDDPVSDLTAAAARFSSLLLSECNVTQSGWSLP